MPHCEQPPAVKLTGSISRPSQPRPYDFENILQDLADRFRLLQAQNLCLRRENETYYKLFHGEAGDAESRTSAVPPVRQTRGPRFTNLLDEWEEDELEPGDGGGRESGIEFALPRSTERGIEYALPRDTAYGADGNQEQPLDEGPKVTIRDVMLAERQANNVPARSTMAPHKTDQPVMASIESCSTELGNDAADITDATQSNQRKAARIKSVDVRVADQIRKLYNNRISNTDQDFTKSGRPGAWFQRTTPRSISYRIARNWRFELLSGLFIIANSAFLGAQTQFQLEAEVQRLRGVPSPRKYHWLAGEGVFTTFFTVELLIRIVAFRWSFIRGRDRLWNLFDTGIVFTSVWELALNLSGVQASVGTSVLRMARIFRIIRLLRVGKSWSLIRNIRTILYALANSGWGVTATLIFGFAITYMFSIVFMIDMEHNLHMLPLDTQDRATHLFGTLGSSFWSLGAMVTGGYDWAEAVQPLVDMNQMNHIWFGLYLLAMFFGIINIMNGIFVQAAALSVTLDRELVVDQKIREEQMLIQEMVNLFIEADSDCSGSVSWDEFQDFMADEKIKAWFLELGLDTTSLHRVFTLLDVGHTGELNLEEYVSGCVQLRGQAKKVDISHLQSELKALGMRLDRLDGRLRNDAQGSVWQPFASYAGSRFNQSRF